jgi:hypothetical protein
MSKSKKRTIEELDEDTPDTPVVDSNHPTDAIIRGVVKTYIEYDQNEEEIIKNLGKRILSEKDCDLESSLTYFSNLVNSHMKSEEASMVNLNQLKKLVKDNTQAKKLFDDFIKNRLIKNIENKNHEELDSLELCSDFISASINHVRTFGRVANPHIYENELAMRGLMEAKKPVQKNRFEVFWDDDTRSNPPTPVPPPKLISSVPDPSEASASDTSTSPALGPSTVPQVNKSSTVGKLLGFSL